MIKFLPSTVSFIPPLRWLRKRRMPVILLGALLLLSTACSGCQAPPPVIGQNCGTVYNGYASLGNSDGENCLWRAYQHCKPATLEYFIPELDIGTQHNLTVQPGKHGCTVSDASQGYSDNGGGSRSPVVTYPCGGLRQQYGGLLFYGCGAEDNLFIAHISAIVGDASSQNYRPYDPTIPTIQDCGVITQYSATRIIEGSAPSGSNDAACLVTYQQQCAFHGLLDGVLDTVITSQSVTHHQILIDVRSSSPCHLIISDSVQTIGLVPPASDIHIFICKGIVENGSTITVGGCGPDGDVVLPPAMGPSQWPSPIGLPFPTPQSVGQACNTPGGSDANYRDCFWQAYQHCQTATLFFTLTSGVADVQHTLIVQSTGGRCTLEDSVQFAPAPAGFGQGKYGPFQTFTCDAMQQKYNELVVANCGKEGELDIA